MRHLGSRVRSPGKTLARSRARCGLKSLGIVVSPLLLIAPATAQHFAGAPTPQAAGLTLSVDPAALAAPYATPSSGNGSSGLSFPVAPTLAVPPGFAVNVFARTGLSSARNLIVAPNGDVLVAEQYANRVSILRDADGDGRAETVSTFAGSFNRPYGLALSATALFVADLNAVWRLPYSAGVTSATSRTQVTAANAIGDTGGHDTRNVVLSASGDRLFVAVGSRGNIAEEPSPRATIQEFNIDGSGQRTLASGLRNPVGMAIEPATGALFTVVNERDGMGDELVPDYLARVVDGGFYGWPYSYFGQNVQPNFPAANTASGQARIASARVPEVAFRSHSAPLGMTFASGTMFPPQYRGGAFVALHGSWNAAVPRAYMVAYVPFDAGAPKGDYSIFASGFWASGTSRAQVIGRPAAVAVAKDGALLIADDGSQTVWRISYAAGSANVIGVMPGGTASGNSFLRLFNNDTAAGTMTLLLRNAANGQLLASWTSPSIAAQASRQFDIAQIEAGASPPVAPGTAAAYIVETRSTFDGGLQHVTWSAATSMLENMTRCDVGPAADLKTLLNVHSTRLASYPSLVRVFNAGASAAAATLTIRDAATGNTLGTWSTPVLEAGAMLETPVATIEAQMTAGLFVLPDHYNIMLDAGFGGVLQHIVRNAAGNVANLTDHCVIKK